MSRIAKAAPLVVLALLFAGCSSDSTDGASEVETEAAETTEVDTGTEPETETETEVEEVEGGHHESGHWSYSGKTGPKHWSTLEGGEACAGKEQSPIALTKADETDLPAIEFEYADDLPLALFNNGHTVQAAATTGGEITIPSGTYPVDQFHFHARSEHTVDGDHAPLELHIVHKIPAADGQPDKYAVVGLMFEVGEENTALAPFFEHIPATVTKEPASVDGETIDLAAVLPEDQTYYAYEGSFTTPPCTQGVQWHVLTEPISISQTQLDAFTEQIEDNARPVQPLGDRSLERDTVSG